ncbi:hypothetical protein [Pseudomonas sp.]|uniref:hypothetical protein n=1 Tax=Pseudomonas sp. TaxID=306 RepID=UPI003F2AEC1A
MTVTSARLDYLHDTLLGPIPKSVFCEIDLTPITPGAFQVRVLAPVPVDLHKAHSVTIHLSSKHHMTGSVLHTHKSDNGDLELQIDV